MITCDKCGAKKNPERPKETAVETVKVIASKQGQSIPVLTADLCPDCFGIVALTLKQRAAEALQPK